MASFLQRILSLFAYLTIIVQVCFGSSEPPLVKVDLYYESLCPYSADFIINQLPKIHGDGLIDIVQLRYLPWGNARLTSNNSFTCQHGPDECLLNTVEACAIDTMNEPDSVMFIDCVERLAYEKKHTQWDTCFQKLEMDPKAVTDCYKGEDGKKLELKYAAVTSALKPPHEYVPWIVINDKPLYDNIEEFESTICKAYKGTPPSACHTQTLASVRRGKTHHVRVTYADQTTKMSFGMKIWSFITSWMFQ